MDDFNFNFGKKNLVISAICIFFIVLFVVFNFSNIINFFDIIENKTFDLRQNIIAPYKKVSKDIVIITIDDKSYEGLTQKFGEWPVPRGVYAKLVNELQKQNPKVITFDLMFVNPMRYMKENDAALIEAFKKNRILYTAINFDNQDRRSRKPIELPEKLMTSVVSSSKNINFQNDKINFSNCRAILPGIINATSNIGHVNMTRSDDGIVRTFPIFVKYRDDFYPHLGLKTINAYLNQDYQIYNIDKKSNLLLNNIKIPLDNEGFAILNWYESQNGKVGSFNTYSLFDVIEAMEQNTLNEFDFKDKIILIGTSASSLYDIKSAPTDKFLPGVGLIATFINNVIDNNFIYKANVQTNFIIAIILSVVIALGLLFINSTVLSVAFAISLAIVYVIVATVLMHYFNLWVGVILPILMMTTTFIVMYIYKYLLKAKDLEYTYKLATTDAMTGLYNHRYFQEQMFLSVETAKRYEGVTSLILIDIDFFKKFNDTYGHQAGDAVLKQVAQVIKQNIRTTDIPCRYGGEEMSVILSNTNYEKALLTAQKICDAVSSRQFKLNNVVTVNVTISLGVAAFPKDAKSVEDMIEAADKNLYLAKENGRNQVGNFVKQNSENENIDNN